MELKDKFEELSKAVHDFKSANDKGNKELTEKLNEKIDSIEGEIKAIQTAMARSNGGANGETEEQKQAKEQKEAFSKYMRKGIESKALSVESDPDGGYLVLPEMSSEIVKKVYESSPMRQLASVQTISTDSLEIIEDLDEAASGWVGETESRAETNTPVLKKIVIPVHELYANPKATQKILDDSMWNMESWLAEKVSDKFARDEATAFISGNGVGKPLGILSYTAGTSFNQIEQVVSGSSGAVTADGLIDLVYSLKEAYKSGAAFLMQRAVVKLVRKLKDSQNQYLWAPGLNGNTQSQLLGFPIYEAADMEAAAANSLSIAFGNFKMGYQIVDRFGIRVLRDPFSSKPYVSFYTTKRVGGAVKNFEAIKLQKLSA